MRRTCGSARWAASCWRRCCARSSRWPRGAHSPARRDSGDPAERRSRSCSRGSRARATAVSTSEEMENGAPQQNCSIYLQTITNRSTSLSCRFFCLSLFISLWFSRSPPVRPWRESVKQTSVLFGQHSETKSTEFTFRLKTKTIPPVSLV